MKRWLTGALFVFSAIVLIGSSVLQGFAEREEGTGYAIGMGIGSLVAAFLVALVLRFAYVRLVATGTPVTGPWLGVVAAAVAFFLAMGEVRGSTEEARENVEEISSRTEECRRSQGGPFRPLADGLRYQALSSAERRAFAERVPPEFSSAYETRRIVEGNSVVAVVIVARAAGELEEARRGFESRAKEEGAALKTIELGGEEVLYGRVAGEFVGAGATRCDFVVITTVDLDTLKFVGTPLFQRP